ncbi:hypothetical protein [Sulfuritalea sp.]|uniref:hypothetical protein n=1 Tax=Sulfuritalea sp. TaxID=2480090 RepID=UPI00286E64C4|nr:hypothetical protein [Sulfuritalea sp.]
MTNPFRFLLTLACLLSIAGCSSGDPGPLAGTWKMSGLVPMTVKFRHGETEALGIIEKVSYEVKGNDVIVTYQDGIAKGMAMRYTVTGPNSVRTEMGVLRRIK